uniref:DUF7852 domain-containing protein n=1 Tax=Acetivibrio cellulolyticus TaxID=35830 RepID=UPI0001E2C2B0|nr:hypothetical protein [Acetivibrio cellulolyticus]
MNNESKNKEVRVESKTITEIESEPISPTSRYGPLVARIPVIISQSKVHINIESEIYLGHSVVDIRSCSRNICLTQCKLLDTGNKKSGKIFLNGYIIENLEYAAKDCSESEIFSSAEIFYKEIKIPFEFSAKIEYSARPVFKTSNRFISVSLPEMSNEHGNFNLSKERLFCELEETDIREADIARKNIFPKDSSNDDNTFDTLIEFITVSIIFTLLQWQQVSIPMYIPYNAK